MSEVELHQPDAQPRLGGRAPRVWRAARPLGRRDGLATERETPVVVLVPAPKPRQRAENPRLRERIRRGLREPERRLVVGAGALEVSEDRMDVGAALVHHEPGRGAELPALGRPDRLVVARERLAVREHGAGRLGRAARVLRG